MFAAGGVVGQGRLIEIQLQVGRFAARPAHSLGNDLVGRTGDTAPEKFAQGEFFVAITTVASLSRPAGPSRCTL
jgi:hypothetical protein